MSHCTGIESITKGNTSTPKGLHRVFETTDFHGDYNVIKRVGKGAFAHVYRAEHALSGQHVAAKVALLSGNNGSGDAEAAMNSLTNEISIMRKVNKCEYCVGASHAYMDAELCYIIMELADSNLPKVLDTMDVTEKSLRGIFRDMLLGLKFIHGLGIVHRDVKPDNFLCQLDNHNQVGPVRLCDFGLSTRVVADTNLTGMYGTAPFMSPEMVKGPSYNEKADIWSLGVIVFVLLTGRFPYMPRETSSAAMKDAIRHGAPVVFKPVVPALQPSEEAEAFGSALLSRHHAKRPSAQRALAFDFLAPNPPLGKSWYKNSLRAMVQSAKKVGAFSVRVSSTVTRIDELMANKQAEARRRLDPLTVDCSQLSMDIKHPTKDPVAAGQSSQPGQAASLDSLPCMASCSKMWSVANQSELASTAAESLSTVTSQASRNGMQPPPIGKAQTMDGLPSMSHRPADHGTQSCATCPLGRSNQRISHFVKPVKPVVPGASPATIGLGVAPAGCGQNVAPRVGAQAGRLGPALPASSTRMPSSVCAQRRFADHEAMSVTVDVLPTLTGPGSALDAASHSARTSDSLPSSRHGHGRTSDSLQSCRPGQGRTSDSLPSSRHGNVRSNDSLPSLPSMRGEKEGSSKSMESLPTMYRPSSSLDQSTNDSLPSVPLRLGDGRLAKTPTKLGQAVTSDSLPTLAGCRAGVGKQHRGTASPANMLISGANNHSRASARTIDVLPRMSAVFQIDESEPITFDSQESQPSEASVFDDETAVLP